MPVDWTIQRLRVFVRVAETLNVSAAARQLYVAQPAVSRYIKELEDAVGVRLFERTGRGVALTEAGLYLVDHARRTIKATEQWQQAVDSVRGEDAGHLRMASSAGWVRILGSAIARFTTVHPTVVVKLVVVPYKQVVDLVVRNEVHLGFLSFVPQGADFQVIQLGTEHAILVVAPDHPLVHSRPGAGSLLALVHSVDEGFMPEGVRNYLDGFGLKISTTMELQTAELIRDAIVRGLGAGLMLKRNIVTELARGALVPVFGDASPYVVPLCAIRGRHRRSSPIQEDFLRQVADVLAEFCGQELERADSNTIASAYNESIRRPTARAQ